VNKLSVKIRKALLILFILLLLLLPLNNENNSVVAQTSTSTSSTDDYSTTTSPLTVMKWAEGSNTSQQVTLYYNSTSGTTTWDTAEMILPSTWQGYKLYTYVYELTENRTWVNNTGFQNTQDPWINATIDVGGTNTLYALWEEDGHGIGDDCILLGEDGRLRVGTTNVYDYDQGDTAYFEQTFSVPRGQVVWAGIILEYNATTDSTWGMTGMFKLAVYVEGVLVWDIHFDSILAENTWYSTGIIPFNASLINTTSTTIRVALEATESVGYSPDIRPRLMIDNVRLFVAARARPSDVNLNMNGLSVQDIDYGVGSVTETNTWTTSPVIANFTWTPSTGVGLDHDIYVTLKTDLTLYIKKQDSTLYALDLAATGKNLVVYNGTDVDWSFYVWVHVPSYYGNYKFNLSIPLDWNITFVAEPTTPSVNRIADCLGGNPGDGYLEVPVYLISATPDGYWILRAKSPNYVYDVWTQVYNSATNQWENSTAFRPSNITRVVARICDASGVAPSDVTLYDANITIYFSNGTVWYTALVTPDVNGYVISENITIGGTNTTGDLYRIEVHWNSEVEAGDLQRYFSVTHKTSLSIWNPSDARIDLQAEVYHGDLVLLTVRFHDEDSGTLIKGATVTCNWTTGIKTLTDLGTGEYETTLDTSQLASNGRFVIEITAQKTYYDTVSITLILDVYYRTVLSSPQAPEYGIPIPIGDNLTVDLYYEEVDTGIGISGATIAANGTWNDRILNIDDKGNGYYTIYFNTTGLTAGYYTIELNASKPFYELRTISIKFLFVYKTKYYPDQSIAVFVSYHENFTVWFKYELFYNGSPVLNASVQVYWLDQWVNMTDLDGDGNYTITLNATLPVGTVYSLRFRASKNLYQSWEVSPVSVIIQERPTRIEIPGLKDMTVNVKWDENGTITVNYLDAWTGSGIRNATITVTWIDSYYINATLNNGTYIIEISTSNIEVIGTYTLIITLDTPVYTINSTMIYVTIEKRDSNVTAFPSELTVVWSDIENITLFYYDVKTGVGISNAIVNSNLTLGVSFIELGNGTYIMIFDSAKVNVRSYVVQVVFDSARAKTANCTIKIHVVRVSTEVQVIEAPIPTPTGDLLNFTILYIDLNHSTEDLTLGVDGALVITNWTYGYEVEPLGGGKYRIILRTESVPIGEYGVSVSISRYNFEEQVIELKVVIRLIKMKIVIESLESVYFTQDMTLIIQVWDIDHNATIEYASITCNLTRYTVVELGDGRYQITFDTTILDVGNYTLYISAEKTNYETSELYVAIQILPIPTTYIIYVSAGNITDTVIRVMEGTVFNITVTYIDTLHQTGIEGATVYIILPNGTKLTFQEVGGGNYTLEINTGEFEPATYTFTLVLSKHQYKELREIIYLTVLEKAPPTGKALLMGALAGTGTALGLFALVASWYFYFRFPAFVRLARSISKRLIKGKPPKFGKVREREEIIRDLIRRDYSVALTPVSLEREEIEVTVPEAEEIEEELVEAGEETLRETAEVIETLTGLPVPEELKELREIEEMEEEKPEVKEEKEEKIEGEDEESS